ncbi:hypothetical protein [Pseudolysinimonas sp.]|uniref:hypothetical protein n=1 Tax=Pseudolysinimonas sp. TaxID=2680009 RepID=UPI003F7F9FBF
MAERTRVVERNGAWGLLMLMAYIGAAIYFIQRTDGGFWPVVLALLQAIVWPVYAVHAMLGALSVG